MAYVYENPEWFMEMIRRFTGQTMASNATTSADHGAIVTMSAVEPVQQHQPMVATATAPGPRASGSGSGLGSLLTMSLPLSSENPGPCIVNMAPDIRSRETSSEEEGEMENAEEVPPEEVEAEDVENEDTEVERAIQEGIFYLLSSPPPAKRRRL
jgi:hypothetical protein